MKMGGRIRQLRNEKGLTQTELGKHLNIGKSTVSQYETDTNMPDSDMILKLSEFFNVSTDYILCRTDNRRATSDPTLDDEITQIMKDLGPDITLQFYDLKGMTHEEKENLKIFLQGLKARRAQKEGK